MHTDLLSSKDWVMLDDASRVLAVASMLLAAKSVSRDGSFEADPEYVQRVAYLHVRPDFKPLLDCGFLELLADASNMQAVACSSVSASPSGISSREGGVGETEPRYSLEQCIRAGATVGVTEEMATAFFTHYAGVNFVDGAGRAIARLPYALAKWKQQQQQRDADYDAKNPYAKFAGTECGRDVSKEPETQEGDEG